MDVAELDEVEFAYLLATLHSRGLIGVDSPGLFPSGNKACDEVYGAGFEHLQADGWLKPLPQAGQYDLNAELVELAAVVADPEFVIFTLALQRIGLPARECVFVDDLQHNVEAATRLGMAGVVHRSYEDTAGELAGHFPGAPWIRAGGEEPGQLL